MVSEVTLLLGLELSPKPSIWAVPSTMIPHGSSVTIFCSIPPGVTGLRLHHVQLTGSVYDRNPQGAQKVAEFFLRTVTKINAGIYHCDYWKHEFSGQGDSMELVVTDAYNNKPSLTAHPGVQLTSGGNVTLVCDIPSYYYDLFILCRDRRASFSQDCSNQTHKTFLISPVSLSHGGTYVCYVSTVFNRHVWSLPSDPVELSVTVLGLPSVTVIVISVSSVCFLFFLLLLLICLCQHRAKCRSADGGTKSQMKYKSSSQAVDIQKEDQCDDLEDIQPEENRHMDTQVPAEDDMQEVTYAQLHQETLMGTVNPLPSRTLQDPSAQPCVYTTLALFREES
ncbi:natural cytotoxicity triggering receptor 1-like isoform X3 [Castor canadensis]|uniref:Natural cytotoxicity triggering receptor 1-like isoform X3 n=1 Tax=Castor canadensis TaxID=51338 RepID=A0AC58LB68_CASCN